MIRLHIAEALEEGAEIAPGPEQTHYLLNVMRLKLGAEAALFNGRDGEWSARLEAAGKRGCRLVVGQRTRGQQSPPDLDLVVALVKRGRLETIVEKATELGCRRIRLVTTRRTNAERTRVDRLQAIATEAAEQTGRLDVPLVSGPEPLDRMLDAWDDGRRLMFCDEAGDDPDAEWGGSTGRALPVLDQLLSPRATGGGDRRTAVRGASGRHSAGVTPPPPLRGPPPPQAGEDITPWAVLIGPEGGFDPSERARLRSLHFVTPVTLGPRILRADTAAIAALTLWQAALGDWQGTKA